MNSRIGIALILYLTIACFQPATSQPVIDSTAVLMTASGEVAHIMQFTKLYYLEMNRWPVHWMEIDKFASSVDSLSTSWLSVRKKFSAVPIFAIFGDTLSVDFELAPFTDESLTIDRAKGIMKMLPGPIDRPGCMTVSIAFTDISVVDRTRQVKKQ